MPNASFPRCLIAAAGLLASLAAPPSLAALQPAAVAGTVVDDRAAPVIGARVGLGGTTRATTTDTRGRFRFDAVAGATVTIEVRAIGFQNTTVTARVGDEQVLIKLAPSVFQLSEIVTTGTAGGEEKRALGNTVATVSASEVQSIAPAVDLSRLINGRAPNVVLQDVSGAAGQGGKFRIRGTTSVSLANDPLIYIDGVRADNATGQGIVFGSTSRFNDIDPTTIESIEIIKGPAAATLYGTEASAGVIQIITKKGRQGRSEIGFETGQGAAWIWDPEKLFDKTLSYYKDATGALKTYSVVRQESDSGRPMFRTGYNQRYAVDVRGGTQGIQYFASGNYEDEDGVVNPNRVRRWTGRVNLQATISPTLTAAVNSGYISSSNQIPDYELLRGAYNAFPAFIGTPARGFLTYPPEVSRQALSIIEDISRTTIGVQLNHSPVKWFNHRLGVGVDDVNGSLNTLRPFLTGFAARFFSPASALGSDQIDTRDATYTTIDYGATATTKPLANFTSKTSGGFQFYRKFIKLGTLSGVGFPAPGVTTISSATTRTATATYIENKTVGVYVQEQLGYKDRLFITGAIRADDNSAFGSEFELITYPKASVSWVVSDEPFFPKGGMLSTLRVRGAFGKSGQQPDQFAALRSYQAVPGPGGSPAVRPQFVGNPALGPEKGREIEVGFEAALFSERLGIDFTYFDKRTDDAILARNVPPSLGFPGVQFANLGTITNKGIELQINTTPVSTQGLKIDLAFSLAHTANKIVDLGGADNLTAGINQFHRVGFPVAGFFAKKVLSADLGPAGPTNIKCDAGDGKSNPTGQAVACATAPTLYFGQPLPDWEGALNTTVQIGQRLTLSGLADFKTGGRNFNADVAIQCAILRLCQANVDPASALLDAADMTVQLFGPITTPEVRFLKIRSLSASYRMPESWVRRIGGTAGAVTVTARNVHNFHGFKLGPDPELGSVYAGSPHNQETFQQIPLPFQFITTVRVTF